MTSIVGVKCIDGIVIGSDSSATFTQGNSPTIEQPTEKIKIIDNHIIVTGTGSVGLGQRFCNIVEKNWRDKKFISDKFECAKILCRDYIADIQSTFLSSSEYGALVAFPFFHELHLCQFEYGNFQPEFVTDQLWFCSMGCAQGITDGFLAFIRETLWNNKIPDIQKGIFAVTWTLDHVININPGGVNGPIHIATLTNSENNKDIARNLNENELWEHRQWVDELKKTIKNFVISQPTDQTIPALSG